jgi:hypothetical protein
MHNFGLSLGIVKFKNNYERRRHMPRLMKLRIRGSMRLSTKTYS